MAFRHYYIFEDEVGKKLGKNAWEMLRNGDDSAFSIEEDILSYEKNCEKSEDYRFWANKILSLDGISNNIVSLGCGKGILEWHLKRIAGRSLRITCSDYTPHQLEKLKKVFTDCDDFLLFDMLNGDYGEISKDATVLIFRCSTEFSKRQFQMIFKKMHDVGIRQIIFIPTEIISLKEAIRRYRVYIKEAIKGHKLTFCGWNYNEKEIRKMFEKYYKIEYCEHIGVNIIWQLKRKE